MDTGSVIVLGICFSLIAYLIGDSQGKKQGYKQAKTDDIQWIRKVSSDNVYLQSENARLAQENGGFQKENEVVKNLLRQQPTTPQAETILKTLGRVEFQLTQFLPATFENGENRDTTLN